MEIIKGKDGKEYRLITLKDLKPEDEEKDDVLLQVIAVGATNVEHYPTKVVYKCPDCTEEQDFDYPRDYKDWRKLPMRYRCPRHNQDCMQIQVNKGQLRKVLLSEQGGTNPVHITGFVYGNDINKIQPGVRINVNGILRSRKKNLNDLTYHRFFDISRFSLTDDKPVIIEDSEKEYFKKLDKTELIRSFAPHIKNMSLIKEGLLISCIGGVEKDTVRGDINTLLLGDPGVAKTQLLKFVTKIIKKSDYVSGKSASGAGLFGGLDNMSDGTRMAKPGSVVMCNGGVACIDEMEKMNPNDRTYAHEVMESQQFSLRKIGVDITWEAKVAIIGAANPKKSRWNTELTINENVNMPDSLMSRFGLIFLIRDIPKENEDLDIARHILNNRMGKNTPLLNEEQIMKFIIYARQINPVLSEEAGDELLQWWSKLRLVEQSEESIPIDRRDFEDLIRLTEAYARLDLSETATVAHANRAISLLNESLQTLGMSTPGERNVSILKYTDKTSFMQSLFKEPISKSVAITRMMEHKKWFPSEERAEQEIERIYNTHSLMEVGDKLKWV
ncbi:MAG: AAA family ATPase [Prolixibacteraceae bacterium]